MNSTLYLDTATCYHLIELHIDFINIVYLYPTNKATQILKIQNVNDSHNK